MDNNLNPGSVALSLFYQGFLISDICDFFNADIGHDVYSWGGIGDTICLYLGSNVIAKVSISQRRSFPLD